MGKTVNVATELFRALNTMFTPASLNLDVFRLYSAGALYAIIALWCVAEGRLCPTTRRCFAVQRTLQISSE
jgi:hypothetical protein